MAQHVTDVVSATSAQWIADTVLTKTYLASCGGLGLVRTCACQYGLCGHCGKGEHRKCPRRMRPDFRPSSSEARVVSRQGHAYTPVWRTRGPACRWRCPCETCIEQVSAAFEQIGRPRRPARPGQLALF